MRNIKSYKKYNEGTEANAVSAVRSVAAIEAPHTAKEEAEARIEDLQDNLLADDKCRTISPYSTLNSETPETSIEADEKLRHIANYDDFGNKDHSGGTDERAFEIGNSNEEASVPSHELDQQEDQRSAGLSKHCGKLCV